MIPKLDFRKFKHKGALSILVLLGLIFTFLMITKKPTYTLKTKTAVTADQTYSDLILLPDLNPSTNFHAHFEFNILKQHRKINPNPWESLWFFWSYQKQTGDNKNTNYLVFKTNGLELGKAFGITDQTFLWTTDIVHFEIGKSYIVDMDFTNDILQIRINNLLFTPPAILKNTFLTGGNIGLYSEDADVQIKDYVFDFIK